MDESIADRIPPELTDAVKSAVADPRFGEIFKMVASARPTPLNDDSSAKNQPDTGGLESLMALLGGGGDISKRSPAAEVKRSHAILNMSEDKKRLLLALKPFLSIKRAAAIDSLLKIYEMGGIASALGLFSN
jgi:hypothetical protein